MQILTFEIWFQQKEHQELWLTLHNLFSALSASNRAAEGEIRFQCATWGCETNSHHYHCLPQCTTIFDLDPDLKDTSTPLFGASQNLFLTSPKTPTLLLPIATYGPSTTVRIYRQSRFPFTTTIKERRLVETSLILKNLLPDNDETVCSPRSCVLCMAGLPGLGFCAYLDPAHLPKSSDSCP